MAIAVHVPEDVKSSADFPVSFSSDRLDTIHVTVEVDGKQRAFGLLVEGVARPPAQEHQTAIQGALDAVVSDWGDASLGATVTVRARADTDGAKDKDSAVVVAVG